MFSFPFEVFCSPRQIKSNVCGCFKVIKAALDSENQCETTSHKFILTTHKTNEFTSQTQMEDLGVEAEI